MYGYLEIIHRTDLRPPYQGLGMVYRDHLILLLLVPESLLIAINRRDSSLGCVPKHRNPLRTELDCLSFRFTRVGVARTKYDSTNAMRTQFNCIIVDYNLDIFQSDQQVHIPN